MKGLPSVQRFGRALGFAVLAALIVGTLDVPTAARQHTDGGGMSLWSATIGLWAVPCLVLTLGAAFGAQWLFSGATPYAAGEGRTARSVLADVLPVLVPATWIGLLLLLVWGGLGTQLLSSDLSVAKGAAIYGLLTLVTLVVAAWVVARSVRVIRARLHASSQALALALAVFPVAVFLVLVQIGETSGAGGPFQLWGVLRREELDLSVPLYVTIACVLGAVAALLSWSPPRMASPVFALVLLVFTVSSRGMSPTTAFLIEQSGAASARLLRAYQRFADRDGDGFAATFGGGDCNDQDAAVQPEAIDVPGNGIDEDCSGNDAKPDAVKSSNDAGDHPPSTSGVQTTSLAPTAETLAATSGTPAPSTLPKDANIVFITIDTLRHDLGYAGNPRPLSPNLDKLAAKALVYDNAYALASYTSKSLGPLLIGRYGSETNRGWMHFNKYPEADTMVQERLKRAGIFTLSVQGHWYFKADTGLGRGFDVLDMSAAPERPQGEGDKTVNSEQISDAAIALLKQPARSDQRFFMWVHYLDPHAEYVTHADFSFGTNGRAKYDAEVAFTDHHVGRVLDAIEAAAFSKRTIVVVTSDHGEAFGEHGLIRHGFELWEELIHVPLLVYVPGATPKHIQVRRSAIDLVPTFLDVLGVPLPQGDDFLSGQSLAAEWGGASAPARPIFVDMPAGPYNGDRQAYIDDDLKIVVSNSRPMGLYNLATDPGETQNLSNKPEQVDAMLERLKAFRNRLRVIKVKPQ